MSMGLERWLNPTEAGTESAAEGGVPRRTFLKISAAAGGGLLLSFILPKMNWSAEAAGAKTVDGFVPNAFIRIGTDGRVTLIMPQVEMGQGTYTSMPMLIAEELEVGLDQIQLEHALPDDRLYANSIFAGFHVTGGSTSVRAFWEPLRRAGATARVMLIVRRGADLEGGRGFLPR